MASGMDIDQIVKDLMKVERLPLQKLQQEKQILEWKRDDYRAMNTLLLDFRTQLTQMKLTTKYRVRTTSSTNESLVTATASSAAGQSSYSISKVTQLAKAETQKNGGSIAKDRSFSAGNGLYAQKDTMAFNGVNVWKDGFVQSKQTTVSAAATSIDLELSNVREDSTSLANWSVTVNGEGYRIVTDISSVNDLQKGQAWYDSATGKLHFGHDIAKDSVVRVSYVAETKTETLSLGKDSKGWNLSYGNLSNASLKLTIDGESETLDIESDGRILRDGMTVGSLDFSSGRMDFNENMPRPAEDSKQKFSLEVTYQSTDAKYTSMSMSTHTSKGEMYGSFLIDGRDSLNAVLTKVNSSKLGVTMFYDDVTQQITMTRNETGDFNDDGNEIEFSMDDQNSFLRDVLRFRGATVTEQGQDAMFTINGLETSRKSNTFQINGVTFTLKKTFNPAEDSTISPVTININNDSATVFENIKEFVDQYNELIDKIRQKTEEERFRSYKPLTDEERERLSDKQQEQWEEKAKSGLLRRDSLLSSLLTEMRMDFSQPVTSDEVSPIYNQMAKLGITTSANYLEGGKLVLDEAKLKKAIEEDPQSVENFFRGEGVTDSGRGISQRLYDTVNSTMDKLKERAGNAFSINHQFVIGRELEDIDDSIDRFEDRLVQIEDRYWRQFTAMEKAIQRANSQMSYLWQQFGGY